MRARSRSRRTSPSTSPTSARQHDIGELKIKISGCINACGHHHVGHIGILGVDKKGEEFYQLTLGGDGDSEDARSARSSARPSTADKVVDAVERWSTPISTPRQTGERFLDTYRRIGAAALQGGGLWQSLGEQPLPPEGPTLILANTEDVLQLGARLDGVNLIVLDFPKFTDGRAYSQARLLRERLGYHGELRATGAVFIDQLPFLLRCGFDSFESDQKGFGEALAKARTLFSVVYQPMGDGRITANDLRLQHGRSVPPIAAD